MQQLTFSFFTETKKTKKPRLKTKLLLPKKKDIIKKEKVIVLKKEEPPVKTNKKGKKIFGSIHDKGFDEILRKACSRFFYNSKQFTFISSDPSISLDDMISECYLNAIKKDIFKNKQLNETVIYFFVKQVFITKAIYQTRHFKDKLLNNDSYEQKKIIIENRYNERNKNIDSDMKELKSIIQKLSDDPVIDGFLVHKDIKTNVSLKSLFSFVCSGFTLNDILSLYKNKDNTYSKKYVSVVLHSMYDAGEKELKKLAGNLVD